MKFFRRFLVTIVVSVVLYFPAFCQEKHPMDAFVDSVVTLQKAKHFIPGLAIGIVRRDSVLLTRGYGVRSIQTGQPVKARTIFHTASITKLFTAEAVMKLIDEGKIELSDRVVELAPRVGYADKAFERITIEHLLRHHSGLKDIRSYRWGKVPPDPLALQLYFEGKKLKLSSEPGVKVEYCNLGYDLLGYIVEVVSGQQFDLFLKERVLLPVGMGQSDTRPFIIADSLKTAPHTRKNAKTKTRVLNTYPYNPQHAPSSTLNASVEDLTRWMVHFFDKFSTKDHYFHKMIHESEPHPLGFQHFSLPDFEGFGHFGGDTGFRSFMLLIPESEIGIVLLGNSDFSEDYRQQIVLPIARRLIQLEN
jgi:CubicO group peptidase (beta-lactamase class C family)